MAELQKWFSVFDKTISLEAADRARLRDQRTLLMRNLSAGLAREYWPVPVFQHFTQGSFALGTAVKPLIEDDIDIDLGIIFMISTDEYPPVSVKKWVRTALIHPARTLEFHRSCVRVQYRKGDENTHHVDMAIYGVGSRESHGNLYLAKGYPGSDAYLRLWEPAAPFALQQILKSRWEHENDRAQMRRVIKYLKRWKDYNFRSGTFGKPTGIALTACVHSFFRPYSKATAHPQFGRRIQYNDGHALAEVVKRMIEQFRRSGRFSIALPVEPRNDLFEKMTINQMQDLKSELKILYDALISAMLDQRAIDACFTLQQVFGEEFPLHAHPGSAYEDPKISQPFSDC
jgi:hypothetical protein